MKRLLTMITAVMSLSLSLVSCNPGDEELMLEIPGKYPGYDNGLNDPEEPHEPANPPPTGNRIRITVDSASFTATLADNQAATAFKILLPMTVDMSELNGNEKYCYLPENLPASASGQETVRNGDIMLYGSNCLVLFYKTFLTSYSYTRLGTVDNPSGFGAAINSGRVTVTFE